MAMIIQYLLRRTFTDEVWGEGQWGREEKRRIDTIKYITRARGEGLALGWQNKHEVQEVYEHEHEHLNKPLSSDAWVLKAVLVYILPWIKQTDLVERSQKVRTTVWGKYTEFHGDM